MHDALHSLLGLGPLNDAQERLRLALKELTDDAKAVNATRRALRAELAGIDDPRVARAAALLTATHPDLAAVAELVAGVDDVGGESAALAGLIALHVPDSVAEITGRVRVAADRVTELAVDETRTADQVAAMLRRALHHHEEQGTTACPVCEQGTLDDAWHTAAAERADKLEQSAAELRRATAELAASTAALRATVTSAPAALAGPTPIDVETLRMAWTAWAEAGWITGAAELAHAVDAAHPPLLAAAVDVRRHAQDALTQRDEVWAPIARRLSAWHDDAARVEGRSSQLADLKKAADWLSATAGALRDQRLAPFAEVSQRVWQQLRQQSNVDLGPVRLDGRSTRRRVAMDVRIDGADGGTALGVMSQGELHALGLSLFLPRATVDQSPFRFVLIDDPVQAMDPAKVDGLARVLADVAATRQVVVFTHDDRLADAVRRLELSATVWEVQRGERSAVEMRRCDDPVKRYIDDARSMALTRELPPDIRGELVASCCRSAIEAACHTKIRTVRLTRGETHAAVEAVIAEANTTTQKVRLAVFDDLDRDLDLTARLRAAGPWASDALSKCSKGAHFGLAGDLRPVVRDAQNLAEWLLR